MRKEIIIDEKHREKIETAIREAEGRATARTIDYEDIVNTVKRIEKHLGIKKKSMEGIKAEADPNAQRFPNAYKYIPMSTHIYLEYRGNKWRLTNIKRDQTWQNKRAKIMLTEEAKQEIIWNMAEMW